MPSMNMAIRHSILQLPKVIKIVCFITFKFTVSLYSWSIMLDNVLYAKSAKVLGLIITLLIKNILQINILIYVLTSYWPLILYLTIHYDIFRSSWQSTALIQFSDQSSKIHLLHFERLIRKLLELIPRSITT